MSIPISMCDPDLYALPLIAPDLDVAGIGGRDYGNNQAGCSRLFP